MFKCFRARSYGYGEARQFIPRWGFIIPHRRDSPGAVSYDNRYSEYLYGTIMVPAIGLPYRTRDEGGVRLASKQLRGESVNATIEPHFNAYNGKVEGAEMLVIRSDGLSRHYAELFLDIFRETFPHRRIRGVKEVGPGDRGYRNLLESKKSGMEVAILSEMFFGDNIADFLSPEEQTEYWRDCLESPNYH